MNAILDCPQCHMLDCTRKVSTIVNAGTSFGSYTGRSDGVGYTPNGPVFMDEYITVNGSSQTTLSRLLSPPAQPIYRSAWPAALVLITAIIWFLLAVVTLNCILAIFGSRHFHEKIDGSYLFYNGVALTIFLSLIILINLYIRRKNLIKYTQVKAQMPHWQRANATWQHLYYCYRCDGVFLPGQSFLIPSEYMREFLYKY